MMYNWDGKEEECYRLYVHEWRSLNEVVEYWEQRGFTPSKRAFQTQFKRWGFPGKQNPAYKNPALTARVKELWEKNTTHKDMLDAVQAEGFQINDRELMRLRTRFTWFLRESRRKGGGKGNDEDGTAQKKRKKTQGPKLVHGNGLIDELAAAILQEAGSSEEDESEEENVVQDQPPNDSSANQSDQVAPSEPLDPAEALRRQLRHQQLRAESDEKWRTRKRRRRTRGWAGLPPDAPGAPPRFPSETTLDESKAYLNLDNKLYAQMRDQFQAICREQGVFKKTVAGPEKWAGLLQLLVRQNHHLSTVFQQHPEVFQQTDALWRRKNYKTLSLDVICQDVTKRMRVIETRMGIPEAKNTLNLNPKQTREIKKAFCMILKADHFTNKFEAGGQHWNELKQRWVEGSELLKHAITPDAHLPDADRAQRLRAIEVLARDVMKRLRAENMRIEKEASGQANKPAHRGPGPGPAPPSSVVPHPSPSQDRTTRSTTGAANSGNATANTSSQGPLARQRQGNSTVAPIAPDADLQIDPSLMLAASDAAVIPLQHGPTATQPQPQHLEHPSSFHTANNHIPSAHPAQMHNPFLQQTTAPLPIYFRLHPRSATALPHKTVWLGVLQGGGGVAEVRALAAREHPECVVLGLEGVIGVRGGAGEAVVGIDNDAELGAYLGHVGAGGGKVTFVVLLGMHADGSGRGGGFV